MAAPTRFDDKRYSKYGNLSRQQDSLLEQLQRQAENRPASRFKLDDWVKSPLGWKRIADSYHTSEGWCYRILASEGSVTYKESELIPMPESQFTPDSEVKLPHGATGKVVGFAGNLIVVELRPKQLTSYTEDELAKHNPIIEYALRLMYRAFTCGDYLFEEDARRASKKALTNYTCN